MLIRAVAAILSGTRQAGAMQLQSGHFGSLPKKPAAQDALAVIFFHIPKTGGTTVESAFAHYATRNALTYEACYKWRIAACNDTYADVVFGHFNDRTHRDGGKWGGSHVTQRVMQGSNRRFYRATMFRHPVERQISDYFFTHAFNNESNVPSFHDVFPASWPGSYQWKTAFGIRSGVQEDNHSCSVDSAYSMLRHGFELIGTSELFDLSLMTWANKLYSQSPLHYVRDDQEQGVGQPGPWKAVIRSAWRSQFDGTVALLKRRLSVHMPPDMCLWKAASKIVVEEAEKQNITSSQVDEYKTENNAHVEMVQKHRVGNVSGSHQWRRNSLYAPGRWRDKCTACIPSND